MEKGSQKTQSYPWICRGFLETLDPQEIGADRDKNRSIQVIVNPNVAKAGGLQGQGVEGEAVVVYREPLTTPDLMSSGLSRRVNNMAKSTSSFEFT